MRVVCTAGHVDHGKSTLVPRADGTGARPARRGAAAGADDRPWLRVDRPGRSETVAFVDLPGHERFVATMLAGAGPVELALVAVATDEGWMPQPAEHLDILDLLGTRRGLVALTKADAVDAETLAIAEELVREQLAPTDVADVADVEIVPVRPSGAARGYGSTGPSASAGRGRSPPGPCRADGCGSETSSPCSRGA